MNYIDGFFDKSKDIIRIVERENGKRKLVDYPIKYTFFYEDPNGKYKSTFNRPLSKVVCKSTKNFKKELAIHSNKKKCESDVNPLFQCLSENYLNKDSPELNIAFFDIETDFNPEYGFSSPSDPFSAITAITIYWKWQDRLITLAIPPKTLDIEKARKQTSHFDNIFIFETEKELLLSFLDCIQDVDVLSGWNSSGYDIPYTVNRITRVLSKSDTKKLCLWDQYPKKREFTKNGKTYETYDLIGRVHLDSLDLYQKYTYEEKHSYRLDAIGEIELGENKVPYEGTLDDLYNYDFTKFIEYNRQDVVLLAKLDKKLQYIDLTNDLAHANTVLLTNTMGAVAMSEQAIINEAHRRGFQVPDKNHSDKESRAVGAYVAYPKKGFHEWVGSMDVTSLYPSIIRSLNMAPETIKGQLRPIYTDEEINKHIDNNGKFNDYWEGKFGSKEYEYVMEKRNDIDIIIDWENGKSETGSAAEVYELIFNSYSNFILSANGTIFTTEFEGIIPGLLTNWFNERKDLQAKKKQAIEDGNTDLANFWDKRQLIKKISLNSIYGVLLNAGCRFYDKRLGQSTTLSGRAIVKHMCASINHIITGEYNHTGDAIIYSDTDSAYFSAYPMLKKEIDENQLIWNKDTVISLYDQICDQANSTFPDFVKNAFHCPESNLNVIKAAREIVASSALYVTKKRYAALVYDEDKKRKDLNGESGKIKAMGLDLRRSDTPVFMQEFLKKILLMVLEKKSQESILDEISCFRKQFQELPSWQKGTPKKVNNIVKYRNLEEKQGKATLPGHVRASLNWNTLKRMNNDRYSREIVDGMKTIVCKLKNNPLGFTSIAYPIDELRLPDWFKELSFDDDLMEETIIDKKIHNLIGVLNYDLESTKKSEIFDNLFEFE